MTVVKECTIPKFTFDVLLKTHAALGGVVPVELVSFNAASW